jgi:hypothetical protein
MLITITYLEENIEKIKNTLAECEEFDHVSIYDILDDKSNGTITINAFRDF